MKMLILTILALGHAAHAQSTPTPYLDLKAAAEKTAHGYHPGIVRHLVTFRFKDGTTQSQLSEVARRFLALSKLSRRDGHPYILSIEAGLANSFEGADQQMQIGFLVTFGSEGDRNYYVGQPLIHPDHRQFYDPAHLAFKEFVGPLLALPVVPAGVFVFDFKVTAHSK